MNSLLSNIRKAGSGWISYLLLFLGCFLFHYLILFSVPYFADMSDSFYHAKMGELYSQGIFPKSFPWLYFTTLHEHFVNHHFLFHVALVPFIWLGNVVHHFFSTVEATVWGVKIAIVTFLSTATLLFYVGLEKLSIKQRWLWMVLFFSLPVDFFFRHYAIRVQSFSLCFLLLGIYAAWEKRYKTLFVISFFYAWVYGGFFYLPIAVGILFLVEGLQEKKWDWKLILASFGVAAGFIISPNFPYNFSFMLQQLFDSGLGMKITVGGEWYPYELKDFAFMSMGPLLLLLPSTLYMGYMAFTKQWKFSSRVVALFVFSLLFLALTLKSKRFIEYWPIFSMLGSAGILGPIFDKYAVIVKRGFSLVLCVLGFVFILYLWGVPYFYFSYISKLLFAKYLPLVTGIGIVVFLIGIMSYGEELLGEMKKLKKTGMVLVVVALIGLGTIMSSIPYGFAKTQGYISYYNPSQVRDARKTMECIKKEAKEGDIIFTDDWDIFPLYFFTNSKNYYIVGLDPIFLYNFDRDLYDTFVSITTGRFETGKIIDTLKTKFHATYVITDRDHKELRGQMETLVPESVRCLSSTFVIHKI